MQSFNKPEDLEAYKAHVTNIALDRFLKLGLGPWSSEMAKSKLPEGAWGTPAKAASDGLKLLLTGSAGVGKTFMLKRIVWSLALRRKKPRGGYLPAMLDKLKSGNTSEYTNWLTSGDVLVLDDLDKIRGTHYEGEKLLAIINHYDVNNLPILVTMNVEQKQFVKRIVENGVPADYAEAMLSRLNNRMIANFISGEDHRKPGEKK